MSAFNLTLLPPPNSPESRSLQRSVQIHAKDPLAKTIVCAVSPLLMTPREVDESVDALIAELNRLRVAAKARLK